MFAPLSGSVALATWRSQKAGMAEPFLEAQLRRIRGLIERMARVQSLAEEGRAIHIYERPENPLYAARDYRMLSSIDQEPPSKHWSESSRRRRRRRR